MNTNTPRPFLKWAGGKHRQIPYLRRKLPPGARLVDPFVGSGAIFLGTDYDSYLLGDANADLIWLYRGLSTLPGEIIQTAKHFFDPRYNSAASYNELREIFNDCSRQNMIRRNALFIYLNRHGYNGLCRYNSRGEFNVPFGRYANPYFPEAELWEFSRKLNTRNVMLTLSDFRETLAQVRPGDVVYCDPPFLPPRNAAHGFTTYSGNAFTRGDHDDLAHLARRLSDNGATVIVHNHSEPSINALYRRLGARLAFRSVRRSISCDGATRNAVSEVVAVFGSQQSARAA